MNHCQHRRYTLVVYIYRHLKVFLKGFLKVIKGLQYWEG